MISSHSVAAYQEHGSPPTARSDCSVSPLTPSSGWVAGHAPSHVSHAPTVDVLLSFVEGNVVRLHGIKSNQPAEPTTTFVVADGMAHVSTIDVLFSLFDAQHPLLPNHMHLPAVRRESLDRGGVDLYVAIFMSP